MRNNFDVSAETIILQSISFAELQALVGLILWSNRAELDEITEQSIWHIRSHVAEDVAELLQKHPELLKKKHEYSIDGTVKVKIK